MFKTEKQARNWAARMKAVGKDHIVFVIPKGTPAYRLGGRFATCEKSERSSYEAGGAVFLDQESAS